MNLLSNGISMPIKTINAYNLPIDEGQDTNINTLIVEIDNQEQQLDDDNEENEETINSLSDFILEKSTELDHLLDYIDDNCPKTSKYLHIRKVIGEVSTELYKRG